MRALHLDDAHASELKRERPPGRHGENGFSLLELLMAACIFGIVAVGAGSSMIAALSLKEANRETNQATLVAQQVAEQLRIVEPADLVQSLQATPGSTAVGIYGLPSDLATSVSTSLSEGRISLLLPVAPDTGVLQEDFSSEEFGLPRDLNQDGLVDGDDRSSDCCVLPMKVRVDWEGRGGPRSVEVFTVLVTGALRGYQDE